VHPLLNLEFDWNETKTYDQERLVSISGLTESPFHTQYTWSRDEIKWWDHLMRSRNKITWDHVISSRDHITWSHHLISSHDLLTWSHHVISSRDHITWWDHMMRSRDEITLWDHVRRLRDEFKFVWNPVYNEMMRVKVQAGGIESSHICDTFTLVTE